MKEINYTKAIHEYDENELERLFFKSKTEDKKILISLLEESNKEMQNEIHKIEENIEYASVGYELLNEKVNEITKLMTE